MSRSRDAYVVAALLGSRSCSAFPPSTPSPSSSPTLLPVVLELVILGPGIGAGRGAVVLAPLGACGRDGRVQLRVPGPRRPGRGVRDTGVILRFRPESAGLVGS